MRYCKDSPAYPISHDIKGFTKYEIVLKDFMCSLLASYKETVITHDIAKSISKEAKILTDEYFKIS